MNGTNQQQLEKPIERSARKEPVAAAYIRARRDPDDLPPYEVLERDRTRQRREIMDRAESDGMTIEFWVEDFDPNPATIERTAFQRVLGLMGVSKLRTVYMLNADILSTDQDNARAVRESCESVGLDLRFVDEG